MKIGILTLPIKSNYGCILQAFALQKVLSEMGNDAWIIRRSWNSEDNGMIHLLAKYLYHKVVIKKFNQFIENYLTPQTAIIDTKQKVIELNEMHFDAYIVGSDQVWRMRNTYGVGFNYFLDFVSNTKAKKIAYAASFGVDYWDDINPEISIPIVSFWLNQFDAISVREESGCKICSELFKVKAKHVLDPTLLLTADDYQNIFSLKHSEQDYIAVYILDMDRNKQELINKVSKFYRLPIKFLNTPPNLLLPFVLSEFFKPSVNQWLSSISNAKYVITDSFHGTLFSIIFKRKFLVLGNRERGLTRIESILDMLNLRDRNYSGDFSILDKEINYDKVNLKLRKAQSVSLDFLKSAL